jgi:hypothetical protein
MSEPIDWNALTPGQWNRLVAEKVMGWTEQPCDLDAHPEMELAIYSDGFACCPRCGVYDHIGSLEHGSIPPPPYSTSMDAAWLVLLKLVGDFEQWSDKGPATDALDAFADELLRHGYSYADDEIYPAIEVFAIIKTWTPERIGLAALRAVGVEVKD